MAFVKRVLRAKITLAKTAQGAQPTFQQSGGTSDTFSGMRMSARIKHAGAVLNSTMDFQIWGMSQNNMNQLSTLGMQLNLMPKNPIVIEGGDEGSNIGTIFQGYIVYAYADYTNAPDVPFVIHAQALGPQVAARVDPTSFQGSADVATIMAGIASQMGVSFENNGVDTKISNPYYSGSSWQQFLRLKQDAGIEGVVENGVLAIWPRNGSRGGAVPLIAAPPKGSMIGYPAYTANGLLLRNVYSPSVGFGRKIKVESSLPAANGDFTVLGLDHFLDAETPNGRWDSVISAYSPKAPVPVK